MTKQEFITRYVANSNRDGAGLRATAFGFDLGSASRYAMPCACGAPECDGWAMMSAEAVASELALRGFGFFSQIEAEKAQEVSVEVDGSGI